MEIIPYNAWDNDLRVWVRSEDRYDLISKDSVLDCCNPQIKPKKGDLFEIDKLGFERSLADVTHVEGDNILLNMRKGYHEYKRLFEQRHHSHQSENFRKKHLFNNTEELKIYFVDVNRDNAVLNTRYLKLNKCKKNVLDTRLRNQTIFPFHGAPIILNRVNSP